MELLSIDEFNHFTKSCRGYHARPMWQVFKSTKDKNNEKIYCGCEIEMEYKNSGFRRIRDEICDKLSAAFNYKYNILFNYYNTDSSLKNGGDDGVECITQPFTKRFFYENLSNFEKFFDIAKDNNMIAHDSGRCGIHVHINKEALGNTPEELDENIGKIIYFFEYYKAELQNFSRRKTYSYTHFASDSYDFTTKNVFAKLDEAKRDAYSNGHSRAVNNEHEKTLEIRLFNSTLNAHTYFAIMEFIYSLIDVITKNKIEECSFYNVVNNDKNTYLKEYLQKRNIIIKKQKVARLDLQYLQNINKSFDKLQKLQLYICKNILPYYKQCALLSKQAEEEIYKNIQKINKKNIQKTFTKSKYNSYKSNLKYFEGMFSNIAPDSKHVTSAFYENYAFLLNEIQVSEDLQKAFNIDDFEEFTSIFDIETYKQTQRRYEEAM